MANPRNLAKIAPIVTSTEGNLILTSGLEAKGGIKITGAVSGFVGLNVASNAGNVTYTLPASDGLNGNVLSTNGAGSLIWIPQSAGGGSTPGSGTSTARTTVVATEGQTTFSVSYVVGQIDVYFNGIKLVIGTEVTCTSGTNIVLAKAAKAGDVVDVVVYTTQWITSVTNLYYNGGNVGIGTDIPNYSSFGGTNRVLSIKGSSTYGGLELVSDATAANGNILGQFVFANSGAGVTSKDAALIEGKQSGASATAPGGSLHFYTRANAGSLSERMTISSAGMAKIGSYISIGSTHNNNGSILSNLVWDGTSYTKIYSGAGWAGGWSITSGGGGQSEIVFSNKVWGTDSSSINAGDWLSNEKMRITASGNLGIGLTNPGAKLEIYGSGNLVRLGDGTNTHDLRFQGPNNWDLQLNTTTDIFSVRRNSVSFLSVDSDAKTLARRLSLTDGNGFSRYALSYSNWGYSNGYKVLVVGSTSTSYNVNTTGAVTVSFNYDPINNTNSAFSGDGREILFRRGTRFVTPNAADTSFNLYNLVMIDGNVGIGTDNPLTKLQVSDTNVTAGEVLLAEFFPSTRTDGSVSIGYVANGTTDTYGVIRSRHSVDLGIGAGSSQHLFIKQSGNVGIGTIDPQARLNISGVGAANNPGLALDITTSASFIHAQENFAANITSGQAVLVAFGREGSTKNSAYIGYLYSGTSGSNNNKLTFGHWGNDHLMVMDGLGNVGIGTQIPGYKLEVNGTIKSGIAGNSSANYAALGVAASGTNDGQAVIAIQQETSEGDTIIFADVEPYVEYGISHENTADSIHFTGGVSTPSLGTKTFYNRSGTARTAYIKTSINLGNGNVGIAGNLSVSGTITESSSITIKENINPIMNALESIISMNGYVYDRKDGTAKQRAGLIAEEVNNVLPNVVAKDDDGNPTGIQYTNLIAYLVESIKTLHKRIESLEK